MEGDGCFPAMVMFALFLGLVLLGIRDCNSTRVRDEWRECRTLLTTSDSATVLRARPECARWTWPQPKEGA